MGTKYHRLNIWLKAVMKTTINFSNFAPFGVRWACYRQMMMKTIIMLINDLIHVLWSHEDVFKRQNACFMNFQVENFTFARKRRLSLKNDVWNK